MRVMNRERQARIVQLRNEGRTKGEISQLLDVSPYIVREALRPVNNSAKALAEIVDRQEMLSHLSMIIRNSAYKPADRVSAMKLLAVMEKYISENAAAHMQNINVIVQPGHERDTIKAIEAEYRMILDNNDVSALDNNTLKDYITDGNENGKTKEE